VEYRTQAHARSVPRYVEYRTLAPARSVPRYVEYLTLAPSVPWNREHAHEYLVSLYTVTLICENVIVKYPVLYKRRRTALT
jgi:hypothetical protein